MHVLFIAQMLLQIHLFQTQYLCQHEHSIYLMVHKQPIVNIQIYGIVTVNNV